MLFRVIAVAAALLLSACSKPPVNRTAGAPLATVASVDLNRYTGLWYEIARFPNQFEIDCVAVTAEYAANLDGTIAVTNTCRKKTLEGEKDVANGTARVVDETTKAKLAVTFFWPFEGNYWIIALADDYTWAIVGEPSGRYLWLLSRTPKVTPELRTTLIAKLEAQGYNQAALYWTPQP